MEIDSSRVDRIGTRGKVKVIDLVNAYLIDKE